MHARHGDTLTADVVIGLIAARLRCRATTRVRGLVADGLPLKSSTTAVTPKYFGASMREVILDIKAVRFPPWGGGCRQSMLHRGIACYACGRCQVRTGCVSACLMHAHGSASASVRSGKCRDPACTDALGRDG